MTLPVLALAQERTSATFEKPPVFPECKTQPVDSLAWCFKYQLNAYVYRNFKVPEKVKQDEYVGSIEVLFEVDRQGRFKNHLYRCPL